MVYSLKRKTLSLLLKGIVVSAAVTGIGMSALRADNEFMGGSHVFMFFTVQSNIAIALFEGYGLIQMVQNKPFKDLYYRIQFVLTVSITLTGVVFCFVLAPILGASAWQLHNILTHVIVPLCAITDIFVSGMDGCVRRKDILLVTIPPLLYAVYAGIGYVLGWEFLYGMNYPYFFLNWGSPAGAFGFCSELPFMGCVWWILILLCFLIFVGWLYLLILEHFKKKKGLDSQSG